MTGSQRPAGLWEGDPFLRHNEGDAVSSGSAAKAFVSICFLEYLETGCLFIMKRTAGFPGRSIFFQGGILADHFSDRDTDKLVYG